MGSLKDNGGKFCVEPQEVGEIFNEYFASVFTKEKNMTDVEVRDKCVNTRECQYIEEGSVGHPKLH